MPKIGSSNLQPVAAKRHQEEPHPLLTLIAKVVDAVFSKLGLGLAGLVLGSGAAFGVLHPLFFAGFVLSAVVLLIYVIERRTEQSLAIKVQKMIETGEVEDLLQGARKAGIRLTNEHVQKLRSLAKEEGPENRKNSLRNSSLIDFVILCLRYSKAPESEIETFRALRKKKARKGVITGIQCPRTSLQTIQEIITPHPKAAESSSH